MARRRKPSEEIEFKLPEFNEEEFIKKERRNTKVAILTFVFGLIIGAISRFLWAGMNESIRWPLIFLFALFMIPFFYKIVISIADTTDYTRKNWLTLYGSYLLTWVVVLTILVNPPFYDETPPRIDMVILPIYQEPGGEVKIAAYITDNFGIEEVNLTIESPSGEKICLPYTQNESLYLWEFENKNNSLGRFNVTLTAVDKNGNRRIINGTFWYSKEAISLQYPANGTEVDHTTLILFSVKELSKEKFRLYYLVDGKEVNLTKSGNLYNTTPMYKGWERGKNVTILVKADVIHYFYDMKVNNTVVDSSVYTFHTDPNDELIGTQNSTSIKGLPAPKERRITPGFEMVALMVAILLVVAWRRRR